MPSHVESVRGPLVPPKDNVRPAPNPAAIAAARSLASASAHQPQLPLHMRRQIRAGTHFEKARQRTQASEDKARYRIGQVPKHSRALAPIASSPITSTGFSGEILQASTEDLPSNIKDLTQSTSPTTRTASVKNTLREIVTSPTQMRQIRKQREYEQVSNASHVAVVSGMTGTDSRPSSSSSNRPSLRSRTNSGLKAIGTFFAPPSPSHSTSVRGRRSPGRTETSKSARSRSSSVGSKVLDFFVPERRAGSRRGSNASEIGGRPSSSGSARPPSPMSLQGLKDQYKVHQAKLETKRHEFERQQQLLLAQQERCEKVAGQAKERTGKRDVLKNKIERLKTEMEGKKMEKEGRGERDRRLAEFARVRAKESFQSQKVRKSPSSDETRFSDFIESKDKSEARDVPGELLSFGKGKGKPLMSIDAAKTAAGKFFSRPMASADSDLSFADVGAPNMMDECAVCGQAPEGKHCLLAGKCKNCETRTRKPLPPRPNAMADEPLVATLKSTHTSYMRLADHRMQPIRQTIYADPGNPFGDGQDTPSQPIYSPSIYSVTPSEREADIQRYSRRDAVGLSLQHRLEALPESQSQLSLGSGLTGETVRDDQEVTLKLICSSEALPRNLAAKDLRRAESRDTSFYAFYDDILRSELSSTTVVPDVRGRRNEEDKSKWL